jgi:hypothetical protein
MPKANPQGSKNDISYEYLSGPEEIYLRAFI